MSQRIIETVKRVLTRAPEWIRQDLASGEPLARIRAEEALAAMVSAAINEQDPSEN